MSHQPEFLNGNSVPASNKTQCVTILKINSSNKTQCVTILKINWLTIKIKMAQQFFNSPILNFMKIRSAFLELLHA